MQCEKFWTNKIVTGGKILGNGSSEMPVVRDQLLSAPLARGAIVAVFHDLEPAITCSVVRSSRVVDLLHVNCAWTFVTRVNGSRLRSIRPVAPLEHESIARVDTGDTRNASLTVDA